MTVCRGKSPVTSPLLSQCYLDRGRLEGQYGHIVGLNLCCSLVVAEVGTA